MGGPHVFFSISKGTMSCKKHEKYQYPHSFGSKCLYENSGFKLITEVKGVQKLDALSGKQHCGGAN